MINNNLDICFNFDNNIIFQQQQLDKYNNNHKHDNIPEKPTSNPTPFPIGALPHELILRCMSLLGVKELGRMAQVSKAFCAAANNEHIWEKKCCDQHEYVDITQLSVNQNSYKLLYKNEDLSRFVKTNAYFNFNGYNKFTKQGGPLLIELNPVHPELKIKHVKQIMKRTAFQHPSTRKGLIEADTPLSLIHILMDENKTFKDEMFVKPFEFERGSALYFMISPSLNSIDYDNLAAAINQSSEPNSIRKEQLETFDKRGGILKMWKEDVKIPLDKSYLFITGCSSGANRSQVVHDFLLNKGCNVKAPLAGGEEESTDFFSQLSGDDYHFICFSHSAASVIRRLLDRPGNLNQFTVIFIPWQDEIAHPPKGIAPYSKEAYKAVYDKLERSFSFLD